MDNLFLSGPPLAVLILPFLEDCSPSQARTFFHHDWRNRLVFNILTRPEFFSGLGDIHGGGCPGNPKALLQDHGLRGLVLGCRSGGGTGIEGFHPVE